MLRQALLPTANAVAAGSTSTFDLDLGKRYHAIWLEMTVGTAVTSGVTTMLTALDALIGQIRVKVNGKVQRTMKASELHSLYSLMGSAFGAKVVTTATGATGSLGSGFLTTQTLFLPIWFAEPWRNNNAEVPLTAWNAAGIDSFQLEVDILSTATSPTLAGFYEYDAPTGGMGAIVKWIRQTFGVSGSAQDFNTISKMDWLQSIHLFAPTSGAVNKVKFTANNNIIRDLMTAIENQAQLAARGMTPDTGSTARFDLVFDYDDPVNAALNANGLNEMTLHLEYASTASGSMVAIIQRTGPPE